MIPLERIPAKMPRIEEERIADQHRANHKRAQKYTDYGKGIVYRCPIPGSAGSTINLVSARAACQAHCNIYHKKQSVVPTYKIELLRGWDYRGSADQKQTVDESIPASSWTGTREGAMMKRSSAPDKTNEMEGELGGIGLQGPGDSTLQLSLQSGPKTDGDTGSMSIHDESGAEGQETGIHAIAQGEAAKSPKVAELGSERSGESGASRKRAVVRFPPWGRRVRMH